MRRGRTYQIRGPLQSSASGSSAKIRRKRSGALKPLRPCARRDAASASADQILILDWAGLARRRPVRRLAEPVFSATSRKEWRNRKGVAIYPAVDAAVRIKKTNMSAAMELQNRTERAREHLREGERLVAALREMIDEQNAVGVSTETTERLLRTTLNTLDRLRTSL